MRTALVIVSGLLGLGAATAFVPTMASAQVRDQVVDIYGDDPCPASNGQEIVVCHRHPRNDQYRIPQALRDGDVAPQALGGTAVAAVNSTGGTGTQIQSCNAIGAGVTAGCLKKQADAWHAQKKADAAAEAAIP